ncbi:hypothetical protein [Roseibium sp.]|uniref:hypothetical protein n=1 Tax=Roseibium sp. TaxID=1936156 RepID=UPI003B52EAA4
MNVAVVKSSVYQDEIANYQAGDGNVSSLSFRATPVRIQNPNSLWIQGLEDRFNELTSLPLGWDGYNGQPVTFNCAQFAANLIERLCIDSVPAPQLVPGADGTLQLEWHMNGFDIEIDVLAPYLVIATRCNHESGIDEEIEIQSDFSELADWIEVLGQARIDLQQTGN